MRARLANLWDDAASSLWLVPGLLVLAGFGLSALLLFIDSALAPDAGDGLPWLFGGTASAARSILSTIAGSLITVIAVAFSVTIVALQQASSQFTPRILRTFTQDRGNQIVLGVYIATFTYSLLVMRQVREATADQAAFIPALSISAAILLALISLALLVYFIHHITQQLQISAILRAVHREVISQIPVLFPSTFGRHADVSTESVLRETLHERHGAETVVRAEEAGYLRRIDEDQLAEAVPVETRLVWVCPRPGEFVQFDAPIARIWNSFVLSDEQQRSIVDALVVAPERSPHQDVMFGIRQMVDIAVKALSPGVNDPTTAEQCLDYLGDLVSRLSERDFPLPLRTTDRGTRFIFNRPCFSDFVDTAFSQIRRAARSELHVTTHLLHVLGQVASRAPSSERRASFQAQVEQILSALPSSGLTDDERATVRTRAAAFFSTLAAASP